MKRSELKLEVERRGFDYLGSSRLNTIINRAYRELCDEEDWGFLETSRTGTLPHTFTDLRTIASVINRDTQTKLTPLDRRILTDIDTNLETTGTPTYYYVTGGDTVNIYPANATASISIRYWQYPDSMQSDVDEPLIPDRYQFLIIDLAVIYAYIDSDNFEAAREMRVELEISKARMRDALLSQQHDRTDDFIVGVVDHQDA